MKYKVNIDYWTLNDIFLQNKMAIVGDSICQTYPNIRLLATVYMQVFPPYCRTISLYIGWLASSPCLMVWKQATPKSHGLSSSRFLPKNPMVDHHDVAYWITFWGGYHIFRHAEYHIFRVLYLHNHDIHMLYLAYIFIASILRAFFVR